MSQFTEHEKQTVRELLEGMILKHEARRWDAARTAAAEAKPAAVTKRQNPEQHRLTIARIYPPVSG